MSTDLAFGACECLIVASYIDDKAVCVTWILAVTFFIDFFSAMFSEQPLKLVVLNIDCKFVIFLLADEGCDCTDSLSRFSADGDRVELKFLLGCYSKECAECSEGQRVGVLEEDDPFLSLLMPFCNFSMHIK